MGATRAALRDLSGLDKLRLSIGGHLRPVRAYYERIVDCQFCLVPKGVGFTNGRLMESFFSGCIPVILSDAMVVPFQTFVDWPAFSIKETDHAQGGLARWAVPAFAASRR